MIGRAGLLPEMLDCRKKCLQSDSTAKISKEYTQDRIHDMYAESYSILTCTRVIPYYVDDFMNSQANEDSGTGRVLLLQLFWFWLAR